jgi:hypothetical protein
MSNTIENHCQRERRSRSNRPDSWKNSVSLGLCPSVGVTRARKQATAKNPASNNSRSISSFIIFGPTKSRAILVRVGLKTIVVMAGVCALQTNPHIVQPVLRLYHENPVTQRAPAASEHEACLKNAARLICALATCSEAETWRQAGGVNDR